MTVNPPQLPHLALTVTDLGACVSWYTEVFGISYQFDGPHQRA